MERELEAAQTIPSIHKRNEAFCKILRAAANNHVGRTKPAKKRKPWITDKIKALVKKRNRLRRNLRDHRQEWIDTCHEVREETVREKERTWREFVEEAEFGDDPTESLPVTERHSRTVPAEPKPDPQRQSSDG